uniref:hypothetical protein n=1 Tax=Saccharibacillus sp. CPCC 101409 TaxID=3058041 RepID=UPI002671323C|nr:hypothetical protein [Saccharibacillus sp. CPCC 101409]
MKKPDFFFFACKCDPNDIEYADILLRKFLPEDLDDFCAVARTADLPSNGVLQTCGSVRIGAIELEDGTHNPYRLYQ